MLKVCIMTDNPSSPTGMARVGREIANGIFEMGHEVVYVGWFKQPPNQKQFPYKVIGCENRFFGENILDKVWQEEQFDVLITIGDIWRLDYISDPKRCRTRRFFSWLAYCAIDGRPFKGGVPEYLIPTYNAPDRVITYTNYAYDSIISDMPEMKDYLGMIYHGVDPNVFFPVPEVKRQEIRRQVGVSDKFVFLVVSRNQPRKNIPSIFKAWSMVSEDEEMKDCMLWPHMNFNDPSGTPIYQILETYGFNKARKKNILYFKEVSDATHELNLPDDKSLNDLYNACDCLIMAGSEGFGLPTLEAMACKKPVIALNHSASAELIADGRGFPVKVAYETTGRWMHEKPFPCVDDLYRAMKEVATNYDKRKSVAEAGYKFAMQHTWTLKMDAWRKEIERVEYPLSSEEVVLKEVTA